MSEVLANGRYVIKRRLAAGGMGEVLLADFIGDSDVTPGLLVVKRILSGAPGMAPAEGQVRMLLEEGRLGLRLQHDNIVETFRTEQDGQEPLLVIELLAGKSMAQVLGQAKKRGEPIPVNVALQILRGACCGLHFAHTLKGPDGTALGLVHRDVSPANIFVTFDGKVKVIDFGVAKSEDSEVKTATGILKGKLGYMSPEQSFGTARLTPQADIWSLGVFFWELLLAERLFSSPNPTATLLQISQKEIPLPSSLRADVPRAVEQLTMTMLSRPLETRFKSCAEIVAVIDGILFGKTVDVGGFLAERFPEDAAAGIADVEASARRARRNTIPSGLVDGSVGVDPADDDDLATAILPSALRQQLLRDLQATMQPQVNDDDDAATIRVDADVLAQVRAMGRLPSLPRMGDDEEDIATRRVDPEMLAAARLPRAPTPLSHQRPPTPPAAGAGDLWQPPPGTTAPPRGGIQVVTSDISPSSMPPPSMPPILHLTAPTGPRSNPAAPHAPSSMTTASSRPVRIPTSQPTAIVVQSSAWQWVTVAAATFGALAVVLGIGVSFAVPAPAPHTFIVYADPAGYDVVVADASHVPVGRPMRTIDPANASLLRAGELEPREVSAAALETGLRGSGVWKRASVPATTKALLVSLLPLIVCGLGLLTLALTLPLIFVSSTAGRRVAQGLLVVVALGSAAFLVQRGGLGWAGRAVFSGQPRLEWR